MSEDNKIMEQEEESRNHDDFLVSMSKIGKSDGRFRLQHKNDETQVLNQPLSELMGQNVTIENILTAAVVGPNFENEGKALGKKNNTQLGKDFKKSYEKSVGKHQNLRLTAPASTVQEAKMNRSATREKFSEQMNKWGAAVHSRRAASTVSYPIQKADMSLKTPKDQRRNFTPKTPLEEEVHKLLYGENCKGEDLCGQSNGLSLRETREKLDELAKVRAHVAYQQAKLKRQNKIKSRKYRRQLRKEKKKEMQQMEKDEDSNEVAEMERITERATLKHSKSSKGLHFVAKHADKSFKNQVLASKDKIRRDLLSKGKRDADAEEGSSSGDDSEVGDRDELTNTVPNVKDCDNPWTLSNEAQLLKLIKDNAEVRQKDQKTMERNVDPNAFIQVNVKGPNFGAGNSIGEGNSSEEEEILAVASSKIYEAFATDDDIMRDFKKEAREKQEARRKNKQNVCPTLPGWGSWVGNTNSGKIKAKNNRAKNRNRMLERNNGPKQGRVEKKDKGYQVIINGGAKGQTVRNHQATNLPFPFTGVSDFEASIRTPIGDTFVPRTSFKKQVQPSICVTKGAIIEPMDKTELMNRGIDFGDEDKDDYEANVV